MKDLFPKVNLDSDKNIISDIIYNVGLSNDFILKKSVLEFENQIGLLAKANAVAVSNDKTALIIILAALGLKKGDEVILPLPVQPSTLSSILHLGLKPILIDINQSTTVIDIDLLEKSITPRAMALLITHHFSNLVDVEAIRTITKKHGVFLIGNSFLSYICALDSSAYFDAGICSFYPDNVVKSIGDAAVIIVRDLNLYETIKMFRNHGQKGTVRFNHHLVGFNSRMDEIVACFLLKEIKNLKDRIEGNNLMARQYISILKPLYDLSLLPYQMIDPLRGFFFLQIPNKQHVVNFFKERGIVLVHEFQLPDLSYLKDLISIPFGIENVKAIMEHTVGFQLNSEISQFQCNIIAETLQDCKYAYR